MLSSKPGPTEHVSDLAWLEPGRAWTNSSLQKCSSFNPESLYKQDTIRLLSLFWNNFEKGAFNLGRWSGFTLHRYLSRVCLSNEACLTCNTINMRKRDTNIFLIINQPPTFHLHNTPIGENNIFGPWVHVGRTQHGFSVNTTSLRHIFSRDNLIRHH